MYTHKNFKTKKALKEAVASWVEFNTLGELGYRQKYGLMPSQVGSVLHSEGLMPRAVTYYQPNDMGFSPLPTNGTIFCEGPHYPEPHKWYAQCEVEDGRIVKVK